MSDPVQQIQSDDEYVLTPHTELNYLRSEVERLRHAPEAKASSGLAASMERLNASITRLNQIFESANDDMVKAFNQTSVQDQMIKILEQQERLAKGIVAVADLVKEMKQPPTPMSPPQFTQSMPQYTPNPQWSTEMNADAQAPVQSRNPFEERNAPMLKEPLPRPGMPSNIPDMEIPPPPPRF